MMSAACRRSAGMGRVQHSQAASAPPSASVTGLGGSFAQSGGPTVSSADSRALCRCGASGGIGINVRPMSIHLLDPDQPVETSVPVHKRGRHEVSSANKPPGWLPTTSKERVVPTAAVWRGWFTQASPIGTAVRLPRRHRCFPAEFCRDGLPDHRREPGRGRCGRISGRRSASRSSTSAEGLSMTARPSDDRLAAQVALLLDLRSPVPDRYGLIPCTARPSSR
jgi:hypothetical protein